MEESHAWINGVLPDSESYVYEKPMLQQIPSLPFELQGPIQSELQNAWNRFRALPGCGKHEFVEIISSLGQFPFISHTIEIR
jgi:hypothetical protein